MQLYIKPLISMCILVCRQFFSYWKWRRAFRWAKITTSKYFWQKGIFFFLNNLLSGSMWISFRHKSIGNDNVWQKKKKSYFSRWSEQGEGYLCIIKQSIFNTNKSNLLFIFFTSKVSVSWEIAKSAFTIKLAATKGPELKR